MSWIYSCSATYCNNQCDWASGHVQSLPGREDPDWSWDTGFYLWIICFRVLIPSSLLQSSIELTACFKHNSPSSVFYFKCLYTPPLCKYSPRAHWGQKNSPGKKTPVLLILKSHCDPNYPHFLKSEKRSTHGSPDIPFGSTLTKGGHHRWDSWDGPPWNCFQEALIQFYVFI